MYAKDVVETKPRLASLKAPESVPEVGVRRAFLEDLALKTIYVSAPASLLELSKMMRLTYPVVDDLFRRLRSETLAEVTGMIGNVPQIALTSKGRSRALELLALNHYVGAPGFSDGYIRQVRPTKRARTDVHLPEVSRTFAHLVLDQETLTKRYRVKFGSSDISLRTTGSEDSDSDSNSSAFQRSGLDTLCGASRWSDHHCLRSLLHAKVDEPTSKDGDPRWVLCHRPSVLVGGELTIEMLELQVNPTTRFYTAPVQMKANNGVLLIIDDFGRQRLSPEELLNRWVVPPRSLNDFLTLAGGKRSRFHSSCSLYLPPIWIPPLGTRHSCERIQTKIRVRLCFHCNSKRSSAEFAQMGIGLRS